MASKFIISQDFLTIDDIIQGLKADMVELSPESRNDIAKGRDFLEKKLEEAEDPIYGINTGFGSLCNTEINKSMLSELQFNLVRSHACGVGEPISMEVSKLIFLLKIIGLSKGNSGVSTELIDQMIAVYNAGIVPVIYEYGSLGASGDLAPLAHLGLVLFGEGEAWDGTQKVPTKKLYQKHGLSPIELKAKEGISILNGTQFMSAFGCICLYNAFQLLNLANHNAAISLEAFSGNLNPFITELHELRKHPGQVAIAEVIQSLLKGSKSIIKKKPYVQDPYSFRCVPQVHGASLYALNHVKTILENEINAVTDNPTLLFKEDKIVSGGNFHGQPLAIAFDYAAIACAELGSISERRVYKLISGERNLPPFLVDEPGINSGFMIPQYAAASIVSRNKQLCTPSSVDTIDSSNGQEDHVSMGANAATKWFSVVKNLHRILSIELLTAFQALDFHQPEDTSDVLKSLYTRFREQVLFMKKDDILHNYMQKSESFTVDAFDLYL
ncbi:histidine ammonia-lyase [Luteibaculum oceani]|uniref:Histidine ammonia-lyase n=1 Tax=Luteibaculum oceani TaxID=1294296 RepID=A0A5C6V9T5_9FLAO|nr:histidine ammonia-lyase [Luteibaculum oceani]TXC81484.1 histidine ammonia-lyase [Luteibaculum oceani]